VDEKIAELIIKNRTGKIAVRPGYDGVYGEAKIAKQKVIKRTRPKTQKTLSDF